ncbi:hypothetical protein FRC04_005629 [Tulasnella sp. 424]|nr:hypothetical protein FRC04_005629 [Tulasnella sp. 424]KAG8961857.1 hypothetical protein FRC05_005689 [Tulasnella sp. 425]
MSPSGQNILHADPLGFGRFTKTPTRKVIVLWDYENCPVPKGVSGLSAIRNIREAALKFGTIDQFEAYCDWSSNAGTNIKNDLSISGVKLRDCPKKGWIGTVDKAIVVDMMVYALERPRTTTVLLISADRDHAYAISTLRNRGYPVKLVAPTGTLHSNLQALADLLDWNSIFKSDLPPTELVDLSALTRGEEEETEKEEGEADEDEPECEDADAEGGEEEEMETGETAQVQVGVKADADETAQAQVEVETEVEETVQPQVEPEKIVQVLVETDDERDSGEPALPTLPQSESVATSAPAEIPPMWTPAQPALPSNVVPLELLSARAQEQQEEERLRSPPLPSASLPTWSQTVPFSYVRARSQSLFGVSSIQQRQIVPPSYVGWSSQPRFWGSIIRQPQTVPPSYGEGSLQHGIGAFSIQQPHTEVHNYGGGGIQPGNGASFDQQPHTAPPSYSRGSNQPGIGASSIQQPQTASPSHGGGSSQPGFGASVVQYPAH